MPYDAEDIDYTCSNCGYVVSGPHQGETAPVTEKGVAPSYKGAPISHSDNCPKCGRKDEYEAFMEKRHGKDWRVKQQQKMEQQNKEARKRERGHIWWRKVF